MVEKYDNTSWKDPNMLRIPKCQECGANIVLHHISNFWHDGNECLGAHFVCIRHRQ